jgi:short-subunit dehydrogenase
VKNVLFVKKYGPWVLVAGASDGIGREIATELSRKGLKLVLVARNQERLEGLIASLQNAGSPEIRIVAADLSTKAGRDSLIVNTADLEIGLFVAAAGFGTSGSFLEGSDDTESNMVELNCVMPMVLSRHYARPMAIRGHGGIIFLSSILGFQGVPWLASYAATKGFVQVLAEGLSVELKGEGVDVLAVAPGPVHSGFSSRAALTYPMADNPAKVARQVVASLGRKKTIHPGSVSTLLSIMLGPLSRPKRARVLGASMQPMVNSFKRVNK